MEIHPDKLYFIQLIAIFITAVSLTIAGAVLKDTTLNSLTYLAWGGLLTFLQVKKG